MHKAVPILALVACLAGCGGSDKPAPTASATATATADANDPLASYSEGVRAYYAGANPQAANDPNADAEVKFFQPPIPAQAKLGEPITLTGSNIGVKVNVTVKDVTSVQAQGKDYTAVEVELDNDAGGITVLDSEMRSAALTYAGGTPQAAVLGVKAPCSNTFDSNVRIDVGAKLTGCLLFPAGQNPSTLQIALETVPTEAGGIWTLD